jgi:hypothetical protein
VSFLPNRQLHTEVRSRRRAGDFLLRSAAPSADHKSPTCASMSIKDLADSIQKVAISVTTPRTWYHNDGSSEGNKNTYSSILSSLLYFLIKCGVWLLIK